VVQAAAAQCRRLDLPQVSGPLPLGEALAASTAQQRLMLYEGPAPSLRALLAAPLPADAAGVAGEVALLIGPEGGFEDSEVVAATAAGFLPCSLGSRILRAETAALAALAVVLTE
jgi:16S rRNA (uracil1498-N3)-methyltransferase